jgi:hypothetical protein
VVELKDSNVATREWLLIAVAGFSLVAVGPVSPVQMTGVATAAEGQAFNAEAPAGQRADPAKPESGTAVARGMGKEAVRTRWGPPEEVRKIRTCFGWQEEWVYRGDAKRFGASERVLLFDEGEILTDMR